MGYLDDILNSEQRAEKERAKAQKEAETIVVRAKETGEKTLAATRASLGKDEAEQAAKQKPALAALYRTILGKGEDEAESVLVRAEKAQPKAVRAIIDRLF